jgi:uncharacterized protein (DUF433 family)
MTNTLSDASQADRVLRERERRRSAARPAAEAERLSISICGRPRGHLRTTSNAFSEAALPRLAGRAARADRDRSPWCRREMLVAARCARGRSGGPSSVREDVCYHSVAMSRAELLSRIAIDPSVCFGKPCIRGHRIWVSLVLDLLASGTTVTEILQSYPGIKEADVLACIAYGAEMSRERFVEIPAKRSA